MTDVLWVTPSFPWAEEPVGGIFYQTQSTALARLGLDLTVDAATPWSPWPMSRLSERWRRYASAPHHERVQGVTVLRPRYLNVPNQPSRARPDRLIARSVWGTRPSWRGARLVHGHYALTGLAAWRVARRARLPFALTFHGSDMNTWPDDFPERRPDLRAAAHDAATVIAVSAALAVRVAEVTGIEPWVLPIGCDHAALERAALPREEARQRLGLADDQVVVLYVGTLKPEKGVPELADAVGRLGDPFITLIVGEGPVFGHGADGPAGGRVRYLGPRPHDEVPGLMSAADVLVLPSHREGLPTVLVEAGSLGLPVIASPVGGIPELLADGRGVILDGTSSEAIAAALGGFLADREDAARRAATLRAHVRSEYDVDRNAARLLARYEAMAPGLAAALAGRDAAAPQVVAS